MITLDGGGTTRLLYFSSSNFQKTTTKVTLQNLTLQNGKSTGTPIPPAPPPCSQGFATDGGGAAIFVRDGILHVWNSTFKNNTGATSGPDVAGGAIYTLGSVETTIVGSTFESNRASNGGAIGALFGNLSIYDSHFGSNQATGSGANSISNQCRVNEGEIGSGGSGGAVLMDGAENYGVTICGSTFTSNVAGKGGLGGALFRTPDGDMQTTTIDRSSFSGNSADRGGALNFHNSNLVVTASTFANNTAKSGGALFSDSSTLNFTNDTFANNVAKLGLGGAIFLSGIGGTLQNITFLGNQANGGSGYFGAAIAGNTTLTKLSKTRYLATIQPKIADRRWPAFREAARALGTCSGRPNISYAPPGTGFARMARFFAILSLDHLPTMVVRPKPQHRLLAARRCKSASTVLRPTSAMWRVRQTVAPLVRWKGRSVTNAN